MNEEAKEALLLKYKDILDNSDTDDPLRKCDEWAAKGQNSKDILLIFLSTVYHEFVIEFMPYIKFILYFKENNWYKYNTKNSYPIKSNLATVMNNYDLFKLIKRRLIASEKREAISFIRILNKFQDWITDEEERNEFFLNHIKLYNNSLNILKDLKIESELYQSLKILMEQLFIIKDEHYQN